MIIYSFCHMWKLNESYVVLKQVHVQRKENEMCKVKTPVQGSCIIYSLLSWIVKAVTQRQLAHTNCGVA